MVGQEHQALSRVLGNGFDPAQEMGTFCLGAQAGQADGLIFENPAVLGRLPKAGK